MWGRTSRSQLSAVVVETTKLSVGSPPLLEQLGALGSLLIHDMANHLCIISGNATFAQMMREDPLQVQRAVQAIGKAGEHLSFVLGQCAEFRRRLGAELPHGQGVEVAAELRRLVDERPKWTLVASGDVGGELLLPTAWFTFAVGQILREVGEVEGQVRLRRVSGGHGIGGLPGGDQLEFRVNWAAPQGLVMDEIRRRFANFGLLASFELIRQCGGKLEAYTIGPGRHEALISAPYVAGAARPQSN